MELQQKVENGLELIDLLYQEFKPSKIFALCSGGGDSLVVTHLASRHPAFSGVMHIDTGIRVVDEDGKGVAEEHVRKVCAERGWALHVYRASENTYANGDPNPQIYEDLVLKGAHGRGFPDAGFPGPAAHILMYTRLKERQLERFVRDQKEHDGDKIMLLTGVRKHESNRRWRSLEKWGDYEVVGSRIWVNAIADFTEDDCENYRREHGLEKNPASKALCMSGECLCGAFSKPGELSQIEFFYPKTGEYLRELEERVREQGYPWGWEGEPPAWWGRHRTGEALFSEFGNADDDPVPLPLCTSCQSKHLTDVEFIESQNTSSIATMTELPVATGNIAPINLAELNSYRFTAIRGTQARQPFYSVMMRLGDLSNLLIYDESALPPEYRAQRPLKMARIPVIADYITRNPTSYVFDSICVAVEGGVTFTPLIGDDQAGAPGIIGIPIHALIRIINGQHRREGIKKAISDYPELANETISVLIYPNKPLPLIQQMFADLNWYGERVATSLSILFDNRTDNAIIAHGVQQKVELFRLFTELEKTTVGAKSRKLFCLNHVYEATLNLFGKKSMLTTDQRINTAVEYWDELIKHVPQWQQILSNKVSSAEIRNDYIHGQGVILVALGRLGKDLVEQHPYTWKALLPKLATVDWSRSNPDWEGLVLFDKKVRKSASVVNNTVKYLKGKLGI